MTSLDPLDHPCMHIEIGRHSYGFKTAVRLYNPENEYLRVGNFCSAAIDSVIIPGGQHNTEVATFPLASVLIAPNPSLDSNAIGPIEIGHDVWVGANAFIMSGSKIGSGSIVAAGAVVSGEFPPYSLIVGTPGRLKKKRFSEEIIEEMLKIEWWHWQDEKIIRNISDFYGPIEEFVAKHKVSG